MAPVGVGTGIGGMGGTGTGIPLVHPYPRVPAVAVIPCTPGWYLPIVPGCSGVCTPIHRVSSIQGNLPVIEVGISGIGVGVFRGITRIYR